MPLIPKQRVVTVDFAYHGETDAPMQNLSAALSGLPYVRVISLSTTTYFFGGGRMSIVAVVEEA